MRRGQKPSAKQVGLTLRQIEVLTAQDKSLALACKEAENSEQSYDSWRRISQRPASGQRRLGLGRVPRMTAAVAATPAASTLAVASGCRVARV